MKIQTFYLLLLLLFPWEKLSGQSILLDYSKEPLNEILLDLNDRYGVPVSINADLSSNCLVTIRQEFPSIDEALEVLAQKCQLKLSKINKVYSFRSNANTSSLADQPYKAKEERIQYLYQGVVIGKGSKERLPFSTIRIGEKGIISDENGRFSFKSWNHSVSVQFRYLGYQTSNLELTPGNNLSIPLQANSLELDEVIVEESGDTPITHIGEEAGRMKFNNINNQLIPGLSNNLIFNTLRLYPGVAAAGESIADFVIWGSYAGQNHIIYDGISLFSSWGINDDIGRVNPHIIKHVEVYKGGYNVLFGDRVGGVVLIDGKTGRRDKLRANLNLTNQLVNAYVNIPMFKQTSSLQIAGRRTYYEPFNLSAKQEELENSITPTYIFGDLNFKFSSTFKNSDQLEISAIASQDSYERKLDLAERGGRLEENLNISSKQIGSSVKYIRNWKGGGLSSLTLSQSSYHPELSTNYLITREFPGEKPIGDIWSNPIWEYTGKLTHSFPVSGKHQIQISTAYINNRTALEAGESGGLFDIGSKHSGRFSWYGYDQIKWSDRFSMQIGIKTDLPISNTRLYVQPRLNGQYELSSKWKLHFGWGIYNQFVSKNPVTDKIGNRADIWQLTDGARLPVLKSMHNVLGLSFVSHLFEMRLEGYYKNADNLSQTSFTFEEDRTTGSLDLSKGEARSMGLDVFIRKQLKKHEFWISYSLGQVKERFKNGRHTSGFELAPQSQKHELKLASAMNFDPFRFTLTTVYGSGFPNSFIERGKEKLTPYWRSDFAFQYDFEISQAKFETGLSILNLFNRKNIRLNQSINVPNGATINTLGVPFTPTIYLNGWF